MQNLLKISMLLFLFSACTSNVWEKEKVFLSLGAEVDRMNPLLTRLAYTKQVTDYIYQPLLQFSDNGEELIPLLGNRVSENPQQDGTVIYYSAINRNARWQDGKKVTGKDVQFTFRQLFNPAVPTSGFRSYLSFVDSIVVDKKHVDLFAVHCNSKYFLAKALLSTIEILPRHFHDPNNVLSNYTIHELKNLEETPAELELLAKDFLQKAKDGNCLGSGPYVLKEWKAGSHVLLEKDKNAWMKTDGAEAIDLRVIPDARSAWSSFQAGDLDVISEVPQDIFKKQCDSESNLKCLLSVQNIYYYVGMNRKHPALSSSALRKALAQGFDLDTWIANNAEGMVQKVYAPIMPDKSYCLKSNLAYDPDAAAEAYTKEGWKDQNEDGFREKVVAGKSLPLELRFAYSSKSDYGKNLGLFFQEELKKLGVRIRLEPMEMSRLSLSLRSGDFDLYFLARYDPPADIDPYPAWHTDNFGRGNYAGFGNLTSDLLIEKIREELDVTKRYELYKDFQRIIFEDQPCLFLFSPYQRIISQPDVKISPTELWPGYRLTSEKE